MHFEPKVNYDSLFAVRAIPDGTPAMDLSHTGGGPPPINFSYGLPDPSSFPVKELIEATARVLEREGQQALQYGPARGYDGLLQVLVDKLQREEGITTSTNNLMLANGASQVIELLCHVFVNPGDTVIVEGPSFIGALDTMQRLGAVPVQVALDDEGMRIDDLAGTLERLARENRKPKFVYTMPNFHNPGAVTMTLPRRRELLDLAREYSVMIVEDDAYRELCYEGRPLPSLYELDRHGVVLRMGTFSKILAAGMRIGWALGPEKVLSKMLLFKFDTGTNHFACRIAAEYCRDHLESHIATLRHVYREKRNATLAALEEHVGEAARWTKPQGGFYVWMELSDNVKADRLAIEARREGVAYLKGSRFYVEGSHENTIRLSFSYLTVDEINEGIRRLGRAMRASMSG